MARVIWGDASSRVYEYGVDRGVLYVPDDLGNYVFAYPWDGLTAVDIGASGRETSPLYQEGIKYDQVVREGDLEGSISAYTYPDEFAPYEGVRDLGMGILAMDQVRDQLFGLSYRTRVGNAVGGKNFGYKIHLLYNLMATPKESPFETSNEDLSLHEFSWDITAIPMEYPGIRPTAHFVFDSTRMDPYLLNRVENSLYGDETTNPTLPSMSSLYDILVYGVKDIITEPI